MGEIILATMGADRKEFGGTAGAFVVVFGLPFFIALLHVAVKFWNWDLLNIANYTSIDAQKLALYWGGIAPNAYSWQLTLGWIAMHVALYLFAPGRIVKGRPDPDTGAQLEYPMNAAFSLFFSILLVVGGWLNDLYSPARVVENFARLATTAMITGFVIAIYLYIKGRYAPGPSFQHDSGSPIYDFYLGIERHPRIGFLDLKYFFEGRPGLTAWACYSIVFCLAQYDQKGSISPPLAIITFLHFLYNFDGLYFEEGMLTMLDIVFDPFGWMLAFGDLAYVPYLYCLPSYYLINHSPELSPLYWVFVLGLGIFAYIAFRLSNNERNEFKLGRLPNAKFITMRRFDGSKSQYLISGWSALARRPNYWPDLLNSLAYSLCTGWSNPIAWIHFATFFVLLAHRQHRLEEKGRLTYKNWNDFKEAVPSRFIPYLF